MTVRARLSAFVIIFTMMFAGLVAAPPAPAEAHSYNSCAYGHHYDDWWSITLKSIQRKPQKGGTVHVYFLHNHASTRHWPYFHRWQTICRVEWNFAGEEELTPIAGYMVEDGTDYTDLNDTWFEGHTHSP